MPDGTPLVRLRPCRSASLSEKPASSISLCFLATPLAWATYRPVCAWAGVSRNAATPCGAALISRLPSGSVR
jgi:hypothetical protein